MLLPYFGNKPKSEYIAILNADCFSFQGLSESTTWLPEGGKIGGLSHMSTHGTLLSLTVWDCRGGRRCQVYARLFSVHDITLNERRIFCLFLCQPILFDCGSHVAHVSAFLGISTVSDGSALKRYIKSKRQGLQPLGGGVSLFRAVSWVYNLFQLWVWLNPGSGIWNLPVSQALARGCDHSGTPDFASLTSHCLFSLIATRL